MADQRAQQELGEIHDAASVAGFFVIAIYAQHLTEPGISVVHQVGRAQSLVLTRVDVPLNLSRHPPRLVQIHILKHPADTAELILAVQDLKSFR